MMTGHETQSKPADKPRWNVFRFDMLLLVFLLIGWSLIFTTATLGLQKFEQPWLPVTLISQTSADYAAKAANEPRLARINPEVVEAMKRDQIFFTPPAASLVITPTLTTEPTVTPEVTLGALEISAGGPYKGQEGSQVPVAAELASSLLNLVPGAVSYAWDLDNDGQYDDADGASTSAIFYDEGNYPNGVQAQGFMGQIGTASTVISVSNVAPLVNIGQDIIAEEGQPATLAATASDPGHDVLLYEWDFGDSSPKVTDTLNPRHTFLDNGNFRVRLTVRDNDGGVTEDTLAVKVSNLPPEVDAGPDQKTNEGDRIAFSGTATDPGSFDSLTYAWDFNYNGRNFTPDATGAIASTTYPDGPANIVAALRVRDKDEAETIETVKVTVANVAPIITGVSNDGPVGEGLPLALTVTATDAGKDDALTYAFDWDNDGSFDDSDQANTVSYIWYNQGDYTVRIRVDDGDGGQAVETTQVTTLNEPPVAVASADRVKSEGTPVGFDASDSSDPGRDDLLTYEWDFGDGIKGGEVNTSHTYGDNGEYIASLTVTDDSGASSTHSVPVTILNANPIQVNAGSDVTVDEGAGVGLSYNGTATDPGAGDTLTYAWDFDFQGSFAQDATGPAGTWTYTDLDGLGDPNSNPKTVALRVQDDDYPFPTDNGGEIGEAVSTFKVTIKNLNPWNVSAGGPYQAVETEVINLTATAEDAPSDLPSLKYEWDLDNNPTDFEKSGQQISHSWKKANLYTVRLRVTDKDGGESFASTEAEIGNALPTAVANGPYTSTVPSPITLSAVGSSDPTNDPLIYTWKFGDGSPAVVTTTLTVTHTYLDDQVYTATLQVDDGRGGIDIAKARVAIINQPPTAAVIPPPNQVDKGIPVTFESQGTKDPDDDVATLIYQWDFGDGTSGSGPTVNHTYTNQGTYTVVLTVIDDDNASDTASITLMVNNDPPVARARANRTNILKGESINFSDNGSSDPNPGDTLTYAWDFGDGNTATGPTVSHTYTTEGNYQATLTVTDSSGASNSTSINITVTNNPPTANAVADRNPISEGESINFDGSGSSDPNPNDPLTYAWDFGDGNTANGVTVTHTYPIDGTYTVTLTVTDGSGATGSTTLNINVNNAPPTARATASLTTVTVGQLVDFDGSGSSDPGNDPLNYNWDFGDGSTANGVIVNHSWTISGTYTIILQVDDNQGGVGTDNSITVQVN
jgi:PKD repeat protein